MEIARIENKKLDNEIYVVDFKPFDEKNKFFTLEFTFKINAENLNKNQNVHNILSLSKNILITDLNGKQTTNETIGNGFDIAIITTNDIYTLYIRYLSGRKEKLFDIPASDINNSFKFTIYISKTQDNRYSIKINQITKYMKVNSISDNNIIIGGKEGFYGQEINKTSLEIIKFLLQT